MTRRHRHARVSRAFRALPTLLRVGLAETLTHRVDVVLSMLMMTQPLIMMSLMTFVAHGGDGQRFHKYSATDFVSYYVATVIIRQLTTNAVAWRLMNDIRLGSIAMHLLRPIHPFIAYFGRELATVPLRAIVAGLLAVCFLATSGTARFSHVPLQIALLPVSIAFGWMISFSLFFAIGSIAFFMTQAMSVGALYFGLFSLFSGYLLPLDTFPAWFKLAADLLPFKFALAVPVIMLTRSLSTCECLQFLLGQFAWSTVSIIVAIRLWRRGVRRFEAAGS